MPVRFTLPDEVLEEIAARAAEMVLARLDARQASPWHSLESGAAYIKRTPEALRKAAERGHVVKHQERAKGRIAFHQDDLDAFMRGEQPEGLREDMP